MSEVRGFHHITAISGPAQENLDFYCGVLGLRLVKLTANYDDPGAYHLYYGDGLGNPGTILTFFPYPRGHPGRSGKGQVSLISLAISKESVAYWVERFRQFEVEFDKPHHRDGGQYIAFRGPDGLPLELTSMPTFQATEPWADSPVPAAKAIGRVRSTTLLVEDLKPTAQVLVEVLGCRPGLEKEGRHRFHFDEEGPSYLDVVVDPKAPPARGGHGSVHHVAFRVADEATQLEIREKVLQMGLKVSTVLDRTYFRSIYFRDPGGILLEVATEGPGFTVDESPEELGSELKLPEQFEPVRPKIQKLLPPLRPPKRRNEP